MTLFADDEPKIRKPRPKDVVFEKAVELFYVASKPGYGIPRQSRKMVNRFVEDLHALGATPELMQERYDEIGVKWPTLTPTLGFLTNRWNELEPKDAKARRLAAVRREKRLDECRANGHLKVRWDTLDGRPLADRPTPFKCYHCGTTGEYLVRNWR